MSGLLPHLLPDAGGNGWRDLSDELKNALAILSIVDTVRGLISSTASASTGLHLSGLVLLCPEEQALLWQPALCTCVLCSSLTTSLSRW